MAAQRISSGTRLGIGSGTTARAFIEALGRRVAEEGLDVTCTAASSVSERLAAHYGMTVIPLTEARDLDLAVDGADAIGTEGVLIKGGGAALVRERLVIASARHRLILVDDSKPIGPLHNVSVPIAVIPFGWTYVMAQVLTFAAQVTLRTLEAKPIVTDDGLYVLDAQFANLSDPLAMHQSLKLIEGVADTGIFAGYNPEIWVGNAQTEWPLQSF